MGIREHVTQIFHSRSQREQDQRKADLEQDRSRTPEEEIGQREARRLAGMSAEDRAWEQASLKRNRDAQHHSTS